MVDKIKNVKFDFFQVKLDDKTYQFENWLDDAQKQIVSDYEKLIVVVGGDKFAIRSVSHEGKDGKYWTALFAKYRSDVPAVGKTSPTQPLDEMKLPDDEFVVEDLSILYDSTKRILMIQRNRFSSGPTYLSKYVDEIRQLWNNDNKTTEFCPIVSATQFNKLPKDGVIKKVNLRTSDIRSVSNPTLRQIFKSQNIPDGLTVEVGVSTGRERSKHIPNDFVDEILTAVSSEGGGLDKAEVSKGRLIQAKVNKNNKKLKDQIVDVELIDLLEGKICVEYNFNLGGNRGNRLNEHVVQAQMSALYERNLNKILSNIK